MTVKELIEKLQSFQPEAEVIFELPDGEEFVINKFRQVNKTTLYLELFENEEEEEDAGGES